MNLRPDVSKEKHEMETKRKQWLKNPQGPPPPDPRIIDWQYYSNMKTFEENWEKGCDTIFVLFLIIIFEWISLFSII